MQSDADRTKRTLDILNELSRDQQIILFTLEDQVREWATVHLGPGHIVELPAPD